MKWLMVCLLLMVPGVAQAQAGDILSGLSHAAAAVQRGSVQRHGTSHSYWWVVWGWSYPPPIAAGPYEDEETCGEVARSLNRVQADYRYRCVTD